jgi:hypothetical protein
MKIGEVRAERDTEAAAALLKIDPGATAGLGAAAHRARTAMITRRAPRGVRAEGEDECPEIAVTLGRRCSSPSGASERMPPGSPYVGLDPHSRSVLFSFMGGVSFAGRSQRPRF